MREGQTQPVRREDYTPPAYWIRQVELTFDLDAAKTIVGSKMTIERNAAQPAQPLRLLGRALGLGDDERLAAAGAILLLPAVSNRRRS